jgi:hypothetical protein
MAAPATPAGLVSCLRCRLGRDARPLRAGRARRASSRRHGRNPPPSVEHVLALWAHNTLICAWPLLLGLTGAARHRVTRQVADGMVVAAMIANTLLVAAALAAYGSPLVAYIPQLPLEWAGLALGCSSWLAERHRPITRGERLMWIVLLASALLAAATVETVAVPHRVT